MLHPPLPLSAISLLSFATAIHATPSPQPQPSTTTTTTTSGCGSALPKELTIGGPSYNFTSLASNSSATHPLRAYSLAIPVDYRVDKPAPLILSFHGRGETNGDQEAQSQFSDPWFNRKAITVYPMGIDRQWQSDPFSPPATTINDTLFITDLLTHLSSTFCLSPTQIYAAGKSNGGGFVGGVLACDPILSVSIRAFAAAAAALYVASDDDGGDGDGGGAVGVTKKAWSGGTGAEACKPGRRDVPILEMHGGRDRRIVYGGGPDANRPGLVTESIPVWLAQWAERDGCRGGNRTVPLERGLVGGNEVNVTTWDCGAGEWGGKEEEGGGGLVTGYFSREMGHVWPTAGNAGFNGTGVMMEFFGKHGGEVKE